MWPERCAHVIHRTQTVGTDAAGTAAAGLAPGVGLITRLYLKSDQVAMCNNTLWSFPARIAVKCLLTLSTFGVLVSTFENRCEIIGIGSQIHLFGLIKVH